VPEMCDPAVTGRRFYGSSTSSLFRVRRGHAAKDLLGWGQSALEAEAGGPTMS
jgi:hypothetical protein